MRPHQTAVADDRAKTTHGEKMTPRLFAGCALAAALFTAATPALAHHSFAPYEPEKQITFTGTVTHYQWTNPHVYIELDAPDVETGEMRHWLIECANPGILNRVGWRHDMVEVGDAIDVIVSPLRNGEPGALLKAIRLADGAIHSNGGPAGAATIEFAAREDGAATVAERAVVANAPTDVAEAIVPTSEVVRGINGSWERYPLPTAGVGAGVTGDNLPDPPAPIPEPPLKPEYLTAWRDQQAEIARLTAEGHPPANNYSSCIGDGMPAMMQGMFPMEVLETPGQVTIIQEAYNQVRRVQLDDPLPSAEDAEPRFAGHSAGRWEGDALVVETVGVKDYVLFRNVPHSMQMKITERIRLLDDPNYMENQITIEDPEYLTGPWTWTWMYHRWPGYELQEYVCEDNKYYADPEIGYQRLRIGDAPAE
jgi:hypothetical protein